MANRTLVEYTERDFQLDIERSAAGDPTILVTLTYNDGEGDYQELTIVVKDAPKVLAPLVAWLKEKENA